MEDASNGTAAKTAARSGTTPSKASSNEKGGKFLTFFLGEEEYGLEILKVHEIIGMMSITPVPRTPTYIRGVVNLRGKIIPVVDLRLKLNMSTIEETEQTCIIVVQSGGIDTGIIVDSVSEVLDIVSSEIDDTPSFGSNISTDYILGIGKSEGHVKILLDIEQVLSTQDMAEMKTLVEESNSSNDEGVDLDMAA